MNGSWLRYAIAAVVLAVIVLGGVIGFRMLRPHQDELDLARSKPSQNGFYDVSIAPESGPVTVGPLHNWVITVTKLDGTPVTDAEITVDGGMPQHGHGLPTSPQVNMNLGGGRYRVEGVRFNMGGWWVLRFAIVAPAGADKAEFNLIL